MVHFSLSFKSYASYEPFLEPRDLFDPRDLFEPIDRFDRTDEFALEFRRFFRPSCLLSLSVSGLFLGGLLPALDLFISRKFFVGADSCLFSVCCSG